MKINIIIGVIVSIISYSCGSSRHCFFDTRERLLYLSGRIDDSIRTVYVSDLNPPYTLRRVIDLIPVVKSIRIDEDSVLNQDVFITLTTDKQNRYSLKLKKEDWKKDTVCRCRYLIR